jgi:hypothetical protein
LRVALALILSATAAMAASQQEEPQEPSEAEKFPFELFDHANLGTDPPSADIVGDPSVPPEDAVPEVFQYRRPDEQPKNGELTGEHLSPYFTEFKVLDRHVEPQARVRVVARVQPPFEKGRRFVAEFFHQEYGRAAVIYVNFKPHEKEKDLYLGETRVSKFTPGGRYNVGSVLMSDEHGHKKAYSPDFSPTLRAEDGTPAYIMVAENRNVDLTPPTLTSISIGESKVAIGENVHVEVAAKDDLSGVTEASAVFISPSGYRSVRADLVGSYNEPGKFYGAFTIPEWYEGGLWKIQKLILTDAATNQALYFTPAEPVLQSVSFEVAQDPERIDAEPPRLVALDIPLREAFDSEAIPVAALVEDDKSGVDKVYVSFHSPSGADLVRVELSSTNPPLNRPSLVPQRAVFRGELKLEKWHERGSYRVTRVNLSDQAQNYLNLNPARDESIRGVSVLFREDPKAKKEATR